MTIEKRITWTYDESELLKKEAMRAAFEKKFGLLQPGEQFDIRVSTYSDCYIKMVPVSRTEPVEVDEP